MHDYYPIIARAVSRLGRNTPEERRDLFERIRRILIEQLRIREPPATESDFRREHAALEHAIERVEAEAVTRCSSEKTSEAAAPVRLPSGSERLHRLGPTVTGKALGRGQATIGAEEASSARVRTRTSPNWLINASQDIQLGSSHVDQRQNEMPSSARPVDRVDAVHQTQLECSGLQPQDSNCIMVFDGSAEGTVAACESYSPFAGLNSKDGVQVIPSARRSDLFAVSCLDELMRAGAEPLAPESVREDSNALLKWLAAENPEALKPKHYEQFAQALRAYMMECDAPVARQPSRTMQSSFSINDDVRAVFDRVLEREQAAMVFDAALTWFARTWVGLMSLLNLIVPIVLIVAASTPAAGFGKLAATYSPLNFWFWVCQVFAFSPALIAIYTKGARAREKADALERAERSLGNVRYRQALRRGRRRLGWRNITLLYERGLRSQTS